MAQHYLKLKCCHHRASLDANVRIIKSSRKIIHHQHLGVGVITPKCPPATPMCADEFYDFVTKNSSFCKLNFEIGHY